MSETPKIDPSAGSSSQEGAISIRMEACDACGMDVKGDGVVYCTTCAAIREPDGPSPEGAGSPERIEGVNTYTPMLWAVLTDDQRYEEYVRVLNRLAELQRAGEAREGAAALRTLIEQDENATRTGETLPDSPGRATASTDTKGE